VTDRIALRWSVSDADLRAALSEHAALIAGEVLAVEYGPDVAVEGAPEHADADLGLRFWLRIA
jgi:isoleucyl-tRNA synthetase